jgi:hypothetical protein
MDEAPQDDASLQALRLAIQEDTNRSFKRTINSCLLIWAAKLDSAVRGRRRLVTVACVPAAVAVAHYRHAITAFIGHIY